MNLGDLSESELMAMYSTKEDNVAKQRARNKGVDKFADPKNLSDEDLQAMYDAGANAAPAKSVPAWQGPTDYLQNDVGPSTQANQEATLGAQKASIRSAAHLNGPDDSEGPTYEGLRSAIAAEHAPLGVDDFVSQDVQDQDPRHQAATDFSRFALGGIAGHYAGAIPAVARAAQEGGLGARMAAGATQGVATAAASTDPHAARRDQILGLLMGAGLGAAGSRTARDSAYVPGSQGAIDEAAYAARGAEPSILHGGMRQMEPPPPGPVRSQGVLGTEEAARQLEGHIHAQVEARNKANGEFIGNDQNAMAEAYRQQNPDGMVDTDPALAAIARIRQQQMGPSGSFMPEQDARLAWAQGAMKQPPPDPMMDTGGVPEQLPEMPPTVPTPHANVGPDAEAAMAARVRPAQNSFVPPDEAQTRPNVVHANAQDFAPSQQVDPADIISSRDANADTQMSVEEAQKLWHALNHRIKNAQPGDMGTAGDRQAAGAVADLIQGSDPRLGPGNLEGTARAYGQEKDNLSRLSDLTWRSDSGMPADRVGQQTTGIQRLGNAGATNEKSTIGQTAEQQNLREIEKLEPSTSPLMDEIRARRTQERREIGLRGGVGVAGTIARSTIGNANNALFRAQGGGVPGTTPDSLILTIEELRKYNELRHRMQQEGHQQ